MQIITSAAYLSDDLKSEFGAIPPSFLPLQNKRLFHYQFAFTQQSNDPVFLTLPQSFEIDAFDTNWIQASGVALIKVPDNLTLSDSVLFAIHSINKPSEMVMILHGDTLFETYPQEADRLYIAHAKDNYNWGNVGIDANNDTSEVYAGLFFFSNQELLKNCLTSNSTDFIAAVELYAVKQPVTLIFADNWMDFGHANTYFRSKAGKTTERVFNNLAIDAYTVNKYSDDHIKMQAEANWFKNIPSRLKKYTPNLIAVHEGEKVGYELDYLYLNTLAELYVFGQNDPFVWNNIFRSCELFIEDCLFVTDENNLVSLKQNYRQSLLNKTTERLQFFSKQINISTELGWQFNHQPVPSLMAIAKDTAKWITEEGRVGYVHGDFCFSNILFDFRKQMIKVIDPRGIDFEKNITTYGDLRYDIAKLSHSVIGLYDYIIAGRFSLEIELEKQSISLDIYSNNIVQAIQAAFLKRNFIGIEIASKQNFALMIHLFLSMLPLHVDNKKRQFALMANVFRLYQIFLKL